MNKKLLGLPSINYTSLVTSSDRREYMAEQFEKYGIENHSAYIAKPFAETGIKITGEYLYVTNDAERGVTSSHIMNIHKWYTETKEEYAIFTEDDLDLSTIDLWNFTWQDFIDRLPRHWDSIQLLRINPFQTMKYKELDGIKIRKRTWCDWGCTYLLNRQAAKQILDRFYKDRYTLEFNLGWDLQPFPENILYYGFADPVNTVWSVPMFVENTKFKSTFIDHYEKQGNVEYDKENGAKLDQYLSSKNYMELWNKKGKKLSIDSIMKHENIYYSEARGMNRIGDKIVIGD